MNRVLLFLTFWLVVSCSSSHNKQDQQPLKQKQDSLSVIKQKRINDSIAIVEKHNKEKRIELSKIAYGDVRFGMSFNQVLNTKVFRGGKVGNDTRYLDCRNDEFRKLGSKMWDISGIFYNDSIYLVTIESPVSVESNKINPELFDQVNILKDVIDKDFGQPDEKYGNPRISEFEPGGIIWMYRWNIEDKTIKLGMAESDTLSKFKTTCYISHEPTAKIIINNRKEAARKLLTRGTKKVK
jgi:hypothetical protein